MMGFWQRLIGQKTLGSLTLTDSEADEVARLRRIGSPDSVIEMHIKFQRAREEADYESSSGNRSTAPVGGSPAGTALTCAQCGRRMEKVEPVLGTLALSSSDIAQHLGPAEECRECGRAYCANCYPTRPKRCPCGIHQDAVRVVRDVTYRGSVMLVKVRYPTASESRPSPGTDIASVLSDVRDLNRALMLRAQAQDWAGARQLMLRLATAVRTLGASGSSEAVKPVADALGDGAQAYENTRFVEAKALVDVSTEALKRLGPLATPLIEAGIKDARPVVSKAFLACR